MSAAVEVLDGTVGPMGRQKDRLESELRVYRGWAPKVSPARVQPPSAQDKRVLHLLTNSLPHTGSGYAQRTHSVLAAQQAAGWQTQAVTRLGYPVQVGKVLARETDVIEGVSYRRLLPARLAKTLDGRLQQQADGLMVIARRFRPSVLHTTTHFTNGLVTRAVAGSLDIPWVYEVRGQLADTWASTRGPEARDSERYRLFQEREAEVMRSADLVVTLGEAMKAGILASGVPEDKIVICPNAVGGDFLKEPSEPRQARRAVGLPEDGLYIGTVSSLVGYEGLNDLVEAFALLAPEFPALRLLIVGTGSAGPALQEQVRRLGLGHRAIFTGGVPRSKTPLYHQALDAFVVPRRNLDVTRSVTPLKPVEAMASGRPVVASDLPALREIVDDGLSGLLVEPENPAALAIALGKLLGDEGLRSDLGRRGRQDVLHNRTWAANAAAYERSYQKLRRAS